MEKRSSRKTEMKRTAWSSPLLYCFSFFVATVLFFLPASSSHPTLQAYRSGEFGKRLQ